MVSFAGLLFIIHTGAIKIIIRSYGNEHRSWARGSLNEAFVFMTGVEVL